MDLDEIKRSVDLIEYLSHHYGIECNPKGYARCPFCRDKEDKNPSFQVKQHNGIWRWYDWHCGKDGPDFSGTIVDLVARMENISEKEAIKKLLKEFESEKSKMEKNTKRPTNGKANKVIEPEIERVHIYRDYDRNPVFKKIKYKENPLGLKWKIQHWTGDKWEDRKGNHEFIPYNLDKFKNHKSVIICEGEKDADIITELDLDFLATSAPTGKGNWPNEITPYFKQFKKATYLYDVGNDEDVKKHAGGLSKALPEMDIYIARVPLKEKEADITDYLEQQPNLKLKQMTFLDVLDKSEKFKLEEKSSERIQTEKIQPIITSLDSISPEPVEWLWFNRIPLGKLSLIVGDPGTGKSFLSIYLAAHVTTGDPWPDIEAPIPKGSVIILTAEDGLADTVRPRADAAVAGVEKIKILEGIINKDGEEEFFNLIEHLQTLKQAIINTENVRLVIIDPITAFLSKIDSHRDPSVRGVLAPLITLAEKYKFAIVGITHLNKNEAFKAIYRTMGSIAFIAAARSVWAISMDENDESSDRRFFTPLKTNLSIKPTSLAFSIIDNQVVFEKHPIEISAEEALSKERSEEISALSQGIIWIKEALEDAPLPANDIYRMAKENRISESTLRRAKEKLKVKSYKEGMGKKGKWFWKLP